jgi:hypothetical protein
MLRLCQDESSLRGGANTQEIFALFLRQWKLDKCKFFEIFLQKSLVLFLYPRLLTWMGFHFLEQSSPFKPYFQDLIGRKTSLGLLNFPLCAAACRERRQASRLHRCSATEA